MKKKVVILLSVTIILLLIIGGVFLWPHYKQIKIEKEMEKLADFIVKETSEGKIVESKDGKLKVIIPEGWFIENEREKIIGPLYILDTEAEKIYQEETQANISKLIKNLLETKSGCLVMISYREEEKSFEEIEEEIKETSRYITLLSEDFFEFEEINEYKGLRHSLDTQKNGYWIDFLVPFNGKTYIFSTVFYRDNKDNCSQEFNKFLDKISIK